MYGLVWLVCILASVIWSGLVCKLGIALLNDRFQKLNFEDQLDYHYISSYTIIRFLKTNFRGSCAREINENSEIYCTWKFPAIWYLRCKNTATASYWAGGFLSLYISLTYFVVNFPTFYKILSEVQSEGLPTTLKSHTCPKKFNKRFM